MFTRNLNVLCEFEWQPTVNHLSSVTSLTLILFRIDPCLVTTTNDYHHLCLLHSTAATDEMIMCVCVCVLGYDNVLGTTLCCSPELLYAVRLLWTVDAFWADEILVEHYYEAYLQSQLLIQSLTVYDVFAVLVSHKLLVTTHSQTCRTFLLVRMLETFLQYLHI